MEDRQIKNAIEERFVCSKCEGTNPVLKEIAVTGTGLSKLFDIQHNKFLTVSCDYCGYSEMYDMNILRNKTGLDGNDLADVLFG
ncbi:zinc ribbon domain-containing protein [Natranaerobius trueperi]|uniref:Nucleic acid-binding protein n=1 Tax=Natranaerobius trueperi TaxID=759412 RepID=A0A226BWL3_9FIRM|nr:zinc ribbon domain-containing protein [Natranaerobius trueperi]OWZ83301.1 hypothetical protein CDO51_09160 [Natranaerobius trueperi]